MEYGHGGDIYAYENIIDFSANINPLKMPSEISVSIPWLTRGLPPSPLAGRMDWETENLAFMLLPKTVACM